jgi:signal transduction histidine kinase
VNDRQITIRSFMSESPDGKAMAHISVTDNGTGIGADDLDKIFTRGFTTDKQGHGFGLHNSANNAAMMKGSLTVNSLGLGQGATFELTLPMGKAASQSRELAA